MTHLGYLTRSQLTVDMPSGCLGCWEPAAPWPTIWCADRLTRMLPDPLRPDPPHRPCHGGGAAGVGRRRSTRGVAEGDVEPGGLDALRVAYRRALLKVAARDLTASPDVMDTAGELADLAAAALEAALAIARAEVGPDADRVRFAIIGMGKCGGRELNYVSDVDVIYVVEPAAAWTNERDRIGDRLAAAVARACSSALRGLALGGRRRAATGRQGRPADPHPGQPCGLLRDDGPRPGSSRRCSRRDPSPATSSSVRQYVEASSPMVWQAAAREGFVDDVQQMRRRVEEHIPATEVDRQLKLGPGGLRDVEFSVQLLQLVHGRTDESLRSGNTLAALRSRRRGYVGRDDAAALSDAYRFLRTAGASAPAAPASSNPFDADRPGSAARPRSFGRVSPVSRSHELTDAVATSRPRGSATAREAVLPPPAACGGPARRRGGAPHPGRGAGPDGGAGLRRPAGALRHIEALTSGVSRRAAIQRTLLPVMLGWFADAPDPDAGLLGFRRVSEALGSTPLVPGAAARCRRDR